MTTRYTAVVSIFQVEDAKYDNYGKLITPKNDRELAKFVVRDAEFSLLKVKAVSMIELQTPLNK